MRVASRDPHAGAVPATAVLRRWLPAVPHGADVWRLAAAGPGVWGNELTVRVIETHRAQTVGDLGAASPPHLIEGRFPWLAVASTSGFMRGTLVRLTQQAAVAVAYRVVTEVDPKDPYRPKVSPVAADGKSLDAASISLRTSGAPTITSISGVPLEKLIAETEEPNELVPAA